MTTPDFDAIAEKFNAPTIDALVLIGSHARGEATPHSDVDIERYFVREGDAVPAGGTHMIDGHLVVVSDIHPDRVDAWFSEPNEVVNVVAGLRKAKALTDRNGTFAAIQERSHAFRWDTAMQQKANAYASEQMAGWIEEVHKGLQGLADDDVGRLNAASFGLSWGLVNVMKVQRGIMLKSENHLLQRVTDVIGVDSAWSQFCWTSFGIGPAANRPFSLQQRVRAGLNLYLASVALLSDAILPEHLPLIEATVERIENVLK